MNVDVLNEEGKHFFFHTYIFVYENKYGKCDEVERELVRKLFFKTITEKEFRIQLCKYFYENKTIDKNDYNSLLKAVDYINSLEKDVNLKEKFFDLYENENTKKILKKITGKKIIDKEYEKESCKFFYSPDFIDKEKYDELYKDVKVEYYFSKKVED